MDMEKAKRSSWNLIVPFRSWSKTLSHGLSIHNITNKNPIFFILSNLNKLAETTCGCWHLNQNKYERTFSFHPLLWKCFLYHHGELGLVYVSSGKIRFEMIPKRHNFKLSELCHLKRVLYNQCCISSTSSSLTLTSWSYSSLVRSPSLALSSWQVMITETPDTRRPPPMLMFTLTRVWKSDQDVRWLTKLQRCLLWLSISILIFQKQRNDRFWAWQ